jgi:GDPmannose 4,6-dehydratase
LTHAVFASEGVSEVGIDEASGNELVKVDPRYFRPTEIDVLQDDASKARSKHRVSFDELVTELVTSDLNAVRAGKL